MAVSLSRCKKSRERRPWRRLGLRCCPVAAFMLLQLSARISLQARRLRCAATALAEDRSWQDLSLVAVFGSASKRPIHVHFDLSIVPICDSSAIIPAAGGLPNLQANVMSKAVLEPLNRFPLFRTSDPEELFQVGSAPLGASRIDVKNLENFEARVNLVQLRGVGFTFGATTCDLSTDHCESDVIKVQFAIKGRARVRVLHRETVVNERQIGIAPSGDPSHDACQAGHARLTLRLNQ